VTKEDKIKLSLGNFVTNISEAISARTHLMRESTVRWVFVPLFSITVLTCLMLFALDALGWIPPMRDALLSVIKVVLGAGVLGAGFAWLFSRK
jgi:small-conductance mechanosensitive channel